MSLDITIISIHALLAESDSNFMDDFQRLQHFYPRSPCGERQKYLRKLYKRLNFYPRSPCGERRVLYRVLPYNKPHFYPRSPCGERRFSSKSWLTSSVNFYPRSPCGERQCSAGPPRYRCCISIHALLAESDTYIRYCAIAVELFLSTLSLRRATSQHSCRVLTGHVISIHALLAESDLYKAEYVG